MTATTQAMVGRHRFVRVVADALKHRCGVQPSQRLLVAVSGGADSVALIRALAALGGRRMWCQALAVGHVQHHLRDSGAFGGDAEKDADFVADLAKRLGLPLRRADLNLADSAGNLESESRRQRYAALGAMAADFDAHHVVTAHHSDDQMETLLMRLLRGASIKGLAGMAWHRRLAPHSSVTLLRPMLAVDRAAARRFLEDIGQAWREDRTNTDNARLRARLRAQVIPELRAIRPDVSKRAVRLGDHLRQIGRWFDHATREATDRVMHKERAETLDRREARGLPSVLLAALLRRLLIDAGVSADKLGSRTLSPVVRAIRDRQGSQRRFTLSNGIGVIVAADVVQIAIRR